MNAIEDSEKLDKLIANYFFKEAYTNSYLMLNDYLEYISKRELFYVASESNLTILVSKGHFFQLYYFINNVNEFISFHLPRPIMMEILYRGEGQMPNEIIHYWENCGFSQHILRAHMDATFKDFIFFEERQEVEIQYAKTDSEIMFAYSSIQNAFDKYTGHISTLEEIVSLVKNKNILCAYYNGTLCGVIKFEKKNEMVTLKAFVISEEFRGNGIGTKLMQAFFKINANDINTRYQLWVRDDNKTKFMYQRSGFKFDNKFSLSMLKEK